MNIEQLARNPRAQVNIQVPTGLSIRRRGLIARPPTPPRQARAIVPGADLMLSPRVMLQLNRLEARIRRVSLLGGSID